MFDQPMISSPAGLSPAERGAARRLIAALHRIVEDEPDARLSLTDLAALIPSLVPAENDRERIDDIAAAERIVNSLTAFSGETSIEFAESQVAAQQAAGVRTRDLGRGVWEQLGLARNMADRVAGRDLGVARELRRLPLLASTARRGAISWRVVTAVVNELTHLTDRDAATADAQLDGQLHRLSADKAAAAARFAANHLDPAAAAERLRKAVEQRRVSVRPQPDTMAQVTALLPAGHAVAVHATLDRLAKQFRSEGDARTLAQLRADLLVERVTGRQIGSDQRLGPRPDVLAATVPADVELQIVMSSDALLSASDVPALLRGYGSIPASLARHVITTEPPGAALDAAASDATDDTPPPRAAAPPGTASAGPPSEPTAGPTLARLLAPDDHDRLDPTRHAAPERADPDPGHEPLNPLGDARPHPAASQWRACRRWLRRLFTDPADETVTAIDARRRFFTGGVRRLIEARDQQCRMPGCDQPIEHIDHVRPHRHRGPTVAANGQGVCAGYNQLKELPGWRVEPSADAPRTLTITTPTGHVYESPTPPVFGPGTRRAARTQVRRDDLERDLATIRGAS